MRNNRIRQNKRSITTCFGKILSSKNCYQYNIFYCFPFKGIWKSIENSKNSIRSRQGCSVISDITDGQLYQRLLQDGNFLSGNNHLTAIFNTDGVNLYSSSHVELWPIFLAINELNPAARFARENMLLVGLWQGKGKPPFQHYMHIFSEHMNSLYTEGIQIKIEDQPINVKLAVICGTLDLPAKASVLNMTFFNGANACITCEEPGVSVSQGAGRARCYPYRGVRGFPMRDSETVKLNMQQASANKRVNGFKGVSGLSTLQSLDLVEGIVPDYMHGILLGITKLLLSKWFSPTESNKEYFIGRRLKEISKTLLNIKPPEFIERLPRDLEKHYSHLKATELQTWLLYYGLPCLIGVLPDRFIEHFACLSESIYILLGDEITPTALNRAEMLLDSFYSSFENLYGRGSCGINVHNAGAHLTFYVKQLGPLWAWSCFSFEDANAMLLKTVHGTGNVLKQVMRIKQCQAHLRRVGISNDKPKMWKITYEAINCEVAGRLQDFKATDISDEVLDKLGITDLRSIKRTERIIINGRRFHAATYERMKRRTCHVVLFENNRIGSIKFFVLVLPQNCVYAIVECLDKSLTNPIKQLAAGGHIVPVKATETIAIILAEDMNESLFYICTSSETDTKEYVVKVPNRHGHSVFK